MTLKYKNVGCFFVLFVVFFYFLPVLNWCMDLCVYVLFIYETYDCTAVILAQDTLVKVFNIVLNIFGTMAVHVWFRLHVATNTSHSLVSPTETSPKNNQLNLCL